MEALSEDVLIYLFVLILEACGIAMSSVLRRVSRRFNHIVNLSLPQVSILRMENIFYGVTFCRRRIPYTGFCSADAKFCKNATTIILKEISIYREHFIRFGIYLENLPHIKSILAHKCSFCYTNERGEIIGQFPGIKKLSITGNYEFRRALIDDISKCHELTHLTMTCSPTHIYMGDVNDEKIHMLTDKIRTIKHLCIAGNKSITEYGLVSIGKHLKDLTHLNLTNVRSSSDYNFYELVKNEDIYESLSFLRLDYTEVTKNGVRILQARFPNLKISVIGTCADSSYQDYDYDDF